MVSTFYSERDRHWIFRGRLALALAGLRAETCRNRRCARTSGCPIMTGAEFEAVRVARGRISESLRPWFLAQDAREEALFKTVPKAKRQQVRRNLLPLWEKVGPRFAWGRLRGL